MTTTIRALRCRIRPARYAALALIAAFVLLRAGGAAAQCCVCFACTGSGFCLDEVADAEVCAAQCTAVGCESIAFASGDDCAGGCEGPTEFPTATPTGTPTGTAAATATNTPTQDVATATATATAEETPTGTPTGTAAAQTPTATPTQAVGTPTSTPTAVVGTPTSTPTAVVGTPTSTPTAVVGTPTSTPTAVVGTPTSTATTGPSETPTATGMATATATATQGEAGTPTATPVVTQTATQTVAQTPTNTSGEGATATATATASITPTPTGGAIRVQIGTAVGQPGTTPGFAVTYTFADRFQIVSLNHCIAINADVPFARLGNGGPDCNVNPALQKPDSTFTFVPSECDPAVDCDAVCASIVGPQGSPVIPVDSMLYSCRIAIPADAENGTYPLACTGPSSATTNEGGTTRLECNDGEVIVQTNLPGDCNGDGMVEINELILGVNIALEIQPVTACPAFDTDDSGGVSIDELIAAVIVALAG